MKKLLAAGLTAGLLVGGANLAIAAPGPNGRNDFGLCKAYFAGSENGQTNKRSKGPFPALEEKAGDADGNGTPGQPSDVAKFCETVLPGGGGGPAAAPGKNR